MILADFCYPGSFPDPFHKTDSDLPDQNEMDPNRSATLLKSYLIALAKHFRNMINANKDKSDISLLTFSLKL